MSTSSLIRWTCSGAADSPNFRVAGIFSGPFVIEEALVIEPNHHKLLLGAAAVADFKQAKIKAVRAYFDDSSLLEQMLAT